MPTARLRLPTCYRVIISSLFHTDVQNHAGYTQVSINPEVPGDKPAVHDLGEIKVNSALPKSPEQATKLPAGSIRSMGVRAAPATGLPKRVVHAGGGSKLVLVPAGEFRMGFGKTAHRQWSAGRSTWAEPKLRMPSSADLSRPPPTKPTRSEAYRSKKEYEGFLRRGSCGRP